MYQLVSLLNGFIRNEIITNPFEFISDNPIIVVLFTYIIGGAVIHFIAFNMVGIIYKKGQAPIIGSILYLLSYAFNVWLILNISKMCLNSIATISIYFIIVIIIFWVSNRIKTTIGGI